jgi:hypothetical protein
MKMRYLLWPVIVAAGITAGSYSIYTDKKNDPYYFIGGLKNDKGEMERVRCFKETPVKRVLILEREFEDATKRTFTREIEIIDRWCNGTVDSVEIKEYNDGLQPVNEDAYNRDEVGTPVLQEAQKIFDDYKRRIAKQKQEDGLKIIR